MALNFVPLIVAALAAAFGSRESTPAAPYAPPPGPLPATPQQAAADVARVLPGAPTAADVVRARAELEQAQRTIDELRRQAGLRPVPAAPALPPATPQPQVTTLPMPTNNSEQQTTHRPTAPAVPRAPSGPATTPQLQAALAAVRWRLQGGTQAELAAAQRGMQGLATDGRWGPHTRDRAAAILDNASQRATPEQRAALGAAVLILHGNTTGPEWAPIQAGMGMPEPRSGRLDAATAARANEILQASGMVR